MVWDVEYGLLDLDGLRSVGSNVPATVEQRPITSEQRRCLPVVLEMSNEHLLVPLDVTRLMYQYLGAYTAANASNNPHYFFGQGKSYRLIRKH